MILTLLVSFIMISNSPRIPIQEPDTTKSTFTRAAHAHLQFSSQIPPQQSTMQPPTSTCSSSSAPSAISTPG
jgi:hypothetical protein